MDNNRRTVRITYFRDTEFLTVSVNQGDEPVSSIVGTRDEAHAEMVASSAAAWYGLDVSRLDVGSVR